jgi:hypothetical protein
MRARKREADTGLGSNTRNRTVELEKVIGCKGLMPRLLPPVLPLLGIWIHTINLDDGGALCQVGSDDDLRKVSEKYLNGPARCVPEQS